MNTRDLELQFRDPKKKYAPMVRWWWFGSGLTKEEITTELDLINGHNFSGVEIQSIYGLNKNPKNNKYTDIRWLSSEWMSLVKHASQECTKLGLVTDMTFGNGWPFGGPHITREYASSKLKSKRRIIIGGRLTTINLYNIYKPSNEIIAVLAYNIKQGIEKSLIDLSPYRDNETIKWNAPLGIWRILFYINGKTKQKVKRAAPGGEGYVLDHLDHNAFKIHSDVIGDKLKEMFGDQLGDVFDCFFCDSWEVYHENWTQDFLSKFSKSKGYELTTFLPYLGLEKIFSRLLITEELKRVKYDYTHVHSNLILGEFFSAFANYCHSVNVKCRVQPYSAPTDLLAAYGMLDVLEIEGFGKHGISTLYYGRVDPRLASSAAHIYGKRRVSCESFTWLGEHFTVTLEQLKRETDQILLHGINQIIYHGFPYSPHDAGNPGWIFYASILANHNNTWWEYIGLLNKHIQRSSLLIRESINVADFLVYLPNHDEWCGKRNILKELRIALKKNGHLTDFDYINDERLSETVLDENKNIIIGFGKYKALILWNTEYLPLKTAQKIYSLVCEGMNLILIEKIPKFAPGLISYRNNEDEMVNDIFSNLLAKSANANSNVFQLNDLESIDYFFNSIEEIPDFVAKNLDGTMAPIKYLHQRINDSDLYFVVNEHDVRFSLKLYLRTQGHVEIWDSLSGNVSDAQYDILEDSVVVSLELLNYESKWVVVRQDKPIKETNTQKSSTVKEYFVPDLWDIHFNFKQNNFPKEDAKIYQLKSTQLIDWTNHPETKYFSGTATYFLLEGFEIPNSGEWKQVILDLGNVSDIAEVKVNSKYAGTVWWGLKRLDITKFVQSGINSLEIKVTNLLINKIIGYDRRNIKWKPDYYFVSALYLPFNAKLMKLNPSGLLGPLKIQIIKETL